MTKFGAILSTAIPLTLLLAALGAYNIVQHRAGQKQSQAFQIQQDRLLTAAARTRETEAQLRADLNQARAQLSKIQTDLASAAAELSTLRSTTADAQGTVEAANQAASNAQAAAAQAQAQLQQAQLRGNGDAQLSAQLADYKTLGTPKEIRARIDKLAQAKVVEVLPEPQPPQTPTAPTRVSEQIATIQKHNPQHDFYVINVGSDFGLKKGDKFNILRNGQAVGRIEITRAQPVMSIATTDRAFPRPQIPFKPGDQVMDVNQP